MLSSEEINSNGGSFVKTLLFGKMQPGQYIGNVSAMRQRWIARRLDNCGWNIILLELSILPDGVMVAQLILVQFVLVRIQVGQPAFKALDLNRLSAFFVALNPEPLLTKKGMMLTYVSKH